MAYIGKQPLVGNYQVLDAIVATTTDTYALTKDSVAVFPQTPANCIVSLNGVIQAPTDSYTISGSDIVFASALTGSDSIDFITVLGDVLNIGTPSDNTVSLAKLTATGTKDATTFLRGDNTFQTIGANTPAFFVTKSSAQSLSNNTNTTITFDTEAVDSNSAFASNQFTVPSGEDGKYFVFGQIRYETSTDFSYIILTIMKNSTAMFSAWDRNDDYTTISCHGIIDLLASDTISMQSRQQSGGSLNAGAIDSGAVTYFGGYKLIGV
jgi:hypothetical protein